MPDPTHEQLAILSAAADTRENLLINALAGTGKTTTLEMIERKVRRMPILYLVFNHRNAREAEGRMLSTTTVRTVNACGHRVWDATLLGKKIVLEKKKTQGIIRALIDASPKDIRGEMWDCFWPVIAGVDMAKALGYIPEGKFVHAKRLCTQGELHATLEEEPDDLIADLIDAVLCESIRQAYKGIIDYNDQIYMPALFPAAFPRFPLGLVDEVQDFSPVNHLMVERLFGNSRLIAVGDRWQNIYAFRGAKHGGMDALAAKFKTKPLDLSISFRCPRAVVEAVHWRVPHFRWMKEGGHVEHLRWLKGSSVADGSAFICRNNAPLFKCAMHALSSGRSVQIAGSDIGPKLVGTMRRLGSESLSRVEAISAVDSWLNDRLSKGNSSAEDLADCMKVFLNMTSNLNQAIGYAEHLFAQKGKLQFLTGHKAKGLEFHTVYHLDPWLCREDEQDLNLRYVITTRSADTLYEVDSEDIKW